MSSERAAARETLLARAAQRFAGTQPISDPHPAQRDPLINRLNHWQTGDRAVIQFSSRLGLNDLLTWSATLWACNKAKTIDLDFRSIRSINSTLAMLFIAHQVRHFQEMHPEIHLHAANYKHLTYPAYVGFFDALGGNFGRKIGEVAGGSNYVPISQIIVRDFNKENGRENIQEAIDSETTRLTTILLREKTGFAHDAVQYSLRELIRNVFEHSGSRQVIYCAQFQPTKKRVELTIADEGFGIGDSLRYNSRFKHLSARQAVHYALLPGVSGNAKALQAYSNDSIWRNSGYGLFMTSQLCRNHGGFIICSSNTALELAKDKKHSAHLPFFRGTLISMNLNLDQGVDFRTTLERLAEQGKRIARDIQGAKVIEASAASQMLRRDFNRK